MRTRKAARGWRRFERHLAATSSSRVTPARSRRHGAGISCDTRSAQRSPVYPINNHTACHSNIKSLAVHCNYTWFNNMTVLHVHIKDVFVAVLYRTVCTFSRSAVMYVYSKLHMRRRCWRSARTATTRRATPSSSSITTTKFTRSMRQSCQTRRRPLSAACAASSPSASPVRQQPCSCDAWNVITSVFCCVYFEMLNIVTVFVDSCLS